MGWFGDVVRGAVRVVRGVAGAVVGVARIAIGAAAYVLGLAWRVTRAVARVTWRTTTYVIGIPYRMTAAIFGHPIATVLWAAGLAWSAIGIYRMATYVRQLAATGEAVGRGLAALPRLFHPLARPIGRGAALVHQYFGHVISAVF